MTPLSARLREAINKWQKEVINPTDITFATSTTRKEFADFVQRALLLPECVELIEDSTAHSYTLGSGVAGPLRVHSDECEKCKLLARISDALKEQK